MFLDITLSEEVGFPLSLTFTSSVLGPCPPSSSATLRVRAGNSRLARTSLALRREERLIHAVTLFLADVEQQLKNVVDKLVAQIAKLAHEEMPPLTYQLLLLANKVRGCRRHAVPQVSCPLAILFYKGVLCQLTAQPLLLLFVRPFCIPLLSKGPEGSGGQGYHRERVDHGEEGCRSYAGRR